MTSSAVQSSKRALRKSLRAILRQLPPEVIQAQSEAVAQRVLRSPAFYRSDAISCYLGMPGEVSTALIIREILRSGKTLFVPKIDQTEDGKMDFLRVYDEQDLATFAAGVWGIAEPGLTYNGQRRQNVLDNDSTPLEMILVPGLAFDRAFSRMGHGKGYYDRFFSDYFAASMDRQRPRPTLMALAFQRQLLPAGDIPMNEHDFKMDAIVTPEEVIEALPSAVNQG